MKKKPSCSLITPTYNWPEALQLLLLSVLKQTILPNEVIIADDGSTEKTKQLIADFQKIFPVPLIHIWQEDIKNRKPRIMNQAIAAAKYEYIVEIDGDIIMNKYFIEDHLTFAKKGQYLFGSRVNIQGKLLTELSTKYQEQLKYFSNYKPSELGTVAMEVVTNIERYRSLLEVMKDSKDLEFYNENRKVFNMYNHLFKLFDREDE